jgi:hypothetical protein
VARVFIAFGCVPFGVDFETAAASFERNLTFSFISIWSPFSVLPHLVAVFGP